MRILTENWGLRKLNWIFFFHRELIIDDRKLNIWFDFELRIEKCRLNNVKKMLRKRQNLKKIKWNVLKSLKWLKYFEDMLNMICSVIEASLYYEGCYIFFLKIIIKFIVQWNDLLPLNLKLIYELNLLTFFPTPFLTASQTNDSFICSMPSPGHRPFHQRNPNKLSRISN